MRIGSGSDEAGVESKERLKVRFCGESTTAMNSRLLRYSAGLVAGVLLLQSYFVRELVVFELLCAFSLIAALVIGGTVCLIGYAVLLWLEQPRRSHAEPQVIWKERSIE